MTTVALRPLDPAADREALASLWRAALHPTWPLLPAALGLPRAGLVAEAAGAPVGAIALHPAGSIQLLVVDPAHQRRGVGTRLLDAGVRWLAEAGAGKVALGSGAADYIWPGVPDDLPAAAAFFAARGFPPRGAVIDLVRDLRDYETPAGVHERAAEHGVSFAVAGDGDREELLAFEAAEFPFWLHWFERGVLPALLARDRDGRLVGTLLAGLERDHLFEPMLGPMAATIGSVGVSERAQGLGIGSAMVARASELLRDAGTHACHIGWTVREAFYGRLGYRPWRRYLMAERPLPGRPR